ncbi:unnamed protein product, partial [marine sediment metagenome]
MIGWFIQGKNSWHHPKCQGNLGSLSLSVTEAIPAINPVILDAQLAPELESLFVVSFEVACEPFRDIVSSLRAIDSLT